MTVRTALSQGAKLLEDARIPAPRLTAEVLLCHAMRRERSYLYAHPEEELTHVSWLHFGRYLHERICGKPTQYITKKQEFYGREFRVTPDVLIPRPETEHVIERVLQLRPVPGRIIDAGCGSGAIAVTLQLELGSAVYATDISPAALAIARENSRRLGAAVGFIHCDLLSAIGSETVDLVVSNPPYIPLPDLPALQREVRDFEPHVALFAGPTGLEFYERLAHEAARVLRPGGWMVMELDFRAADPARNLLIQWEQVQIDRDLGGLPRVISARKPA